MRDVLEPLLDWWRAGRTVGVGTVVATYRSAPRPAGATMVVGPGDTVFGSVSGGCVEGAVFDLATTAIESGRGTLQRYGISDDDAFAVGLTCGGILDVWVEPVSQETFPELAEVADLVARDRPVAIATVIRHDEADVIGRRIIVRLSEAAGGYEGQGSLGSPGLDAAVVRAAESLLGSGASAVVTTGIEGRPGEEVDIFIHVLASRPRMIVVGAIDFAAAMSRVGRLLGYDVTVVDARPVFATTERFPAADSVVVDWPHRYLRAEYDAGRLDDRSAIVVLTHDPKFDVPALEVALRLSDVGYVGAMGSRRTHEDRTARLLEAGLVREELARLASPIGLDLGARTPEETAVSIAAEIIARRHGGTGASLSRSGGPIHHGGGRLEPGDWVSDECKIQKLT